MALSKVDYNSLNVTAAASKALKWNSTPNGFETGDVAGSMVLLATATASSDSTITFDSDIDDTYKEYVFKTLDPPVLPIWPSGANKLKIVIWTSIAGVVSSIAVLLLVFYLGYQIVETGLFRYKLRKI